MPRFAQQEKEKESILGSYKKEKGCFA